MPEFMRAYVERAADGAGKPGDPIRFVASTEGVARDGMVIPADAWQLDNFRANPVMLWSHSYFDEPIGRVTDIGVEDKRLMATVVFDQSDERALRIERKVRSGILSASSIGWDTLAFEPSKGEGQPPRVTRADLLDFSIVSVPSDPKALKERQKRAYADLGAELLKIADGDDDDPENPPARTTKTASDPAPERLSWDDAATAMVRLNMPYNQRSDEDREREWKRIKREYDRHKQQAPEFVTNTQLEAWGPDELRGLFLAGEPEMFPDIFAWFDVRAGAAINARNRKDIEQAASLLQGVLERSAKATEQDESTDEAARAESALAKKLAETFGVNIDGD